MKGYLFMPHDSNNILFSISTFILILLASRTSLAHPKPIKDIYFTSPSDIGTSVSINDNGDLNYKIVLSGEKIIEYSKLGITIDGVDLGSGVRLNEPKKEKSNESFPVMGVHSKGRHNCSIVKIPVTHIKSRTSYSVEFQACEEGVAYRYIVPENGKRTVNGETSSWRFPDDVTFWYQTNTKYYEGIHEKSTRITANTQIGPPMTVVYPSGKYVSVTEAAASPKYSGMTLGARDYNTFDAEFLDDIGGWKYDGEIVTPWRVVLIAKDLNGLFNSDLIYALNKPPSKELANAEWIKPGRSLWSYLTNDRVVTPENQRKYIDAAAQLGFEYILVDAGWEDPPDKGGWSTENKSSMDVMRELVQYAKERKVGIWVWTYYSRLLNPESRAKYFDQLAKIGVVGDKIDFMESESVAMLKFYEGCLRDSAKRQLMIDFHGANKPTGEARTWPNEMTREGVRGLEYRDLPVTYMVALPFTRLIAGNADFTPMHFNSYWMSNTTRGFQLASGMILDSPVTFFGGDPDDYLKSPARELISAMPTVWDETIVLPQSEIGVTAALARRSKDSWFIAIMNGASMRKIEIKLDFLKDGNYKMSAYLDPTAKKEESAVIKNDVIRISLRASGGYVAKIEKVQ
jgi:hypothetical protein